MLQKGFTLIELMIVVAIIGILSMFALPAYQDYTKRTYVSEGMALATAAKLASTEVFSSTGAWPSTNALAGVANADAITGQAIAGIEIIHGTPYDGDFAKLGIVGANGTLDITTATTTNILIHYNQKVTNDVTQNTYTAGPGDGVLAIAPVLYDDMADQGSVRWACKQRTDNANAIQNKWLPANCRTESAP